MSYFLLVVTISGAIHSGAEFSTLKECMKVASETLRGLPNSEAACWVMKEAPTGIEPAPSPKPSRRG